MFPSEEEKYFAIMTIILTLDYELFLNDITGTVSNCLEKPMFELQKVCDKHGFHYTVFIDAAYLFMLKQLKTNNKQLEADYQRVCESINWMHSKGHDIQLHIHPQWYYSRHIDGKWVLDWNHYRLADMNREDAARCFELSKNLLDEIIGEKTLIFRAGGYSLTESDYYSMFKKNGIIADSSVLPGVREITSTHKFDYRGLPNKPFFFSEDICDPKTDGCFLELPISLAKKVLITKYLTKKKKYISIPENVNWGDGGDLPPVGLLKKVKRRMGSITVFKHPKATIDYQSFFFLRDAYNNSKASGYMTIIGHPKNFSPAALAYFDSFIGDCRAVDDRVITAMEYCVERREKSLVK